MKKRDVPTGGLPSRHVTLLWQFMNASIFQFFLMTAFTSFSFAFDSHAQEVLNRPVTLKIEGQRLRFVLTQIEQQTAARFVYSSKAIGVDRPVTIITEEKRLADVLGELLKPLKLSYRMVGGQIILENDANAQTRNTPIMPAAEHSVSGQVIDEKNVGLPGVSVVIKGTTVGSTTDADGKFKLNVPDGDGVVLTFSFVGYQSQDVAVGSKATINVSMTPDISALDEVVVWATGPFVKRT